MKLDEIATGIQDSMHLPLNWIYPTSRRHICRSFRASSFRSQMWPTYWVYTWRRKGLTSCGLRTDKCTRNLPSQFRYISSQLIWRSEWKKRERRQGLPPHPLPQYSILLTKSGHEEMKGSFIRQKNITRSHWKPLCILECCVLWRQVEDKLE